MAQTPPYPDLVLPAEERFSAEETPLLVGQFRFIYEDERWEWSAEAAQIHGYPAKPMNPSMALVMSHKHWDDHARMTAALDDVRRTREPISTRHRIVDVRGRTRLVIVVGQQLLDAVGAVIGTQGFYIDITGPDGAARQRDQEVSAAVAEIAERRGVIEEVKGMLMLIYCVDEETAFALLRWRSQNTNTKLRQLAQQLRDDFLSLNYGEFLPPRSTFDELLLTAHERVRTAATS